MKAPRLSLRIACAVISSFCATQSLAQQNIGDSCNAALSSGIRDNYFLLTERELYDQYQNRLCTASYSSYEDFASSGGSLGLNIPIAEGIIGLSGNAQEKSSEFSQRYSAYCSSNFSNTEFSDRFSGFSSTVSSALVENWSICQQSYLTAWMNINSVGVFVDVTPQDDFSRFTVNVTRRSRINDPLVIESLSPEGLVTCHSGGESVEMGKTEFNRNSFLITCEKHPLRPISFALDTSEGSSNAVQVPAQTSQIFELQQQSDSLRIRLAQLEAAIEGVSDEHAAFEGSVRSALEAWGSGSQDVRSARRMVECPSGYYLAGIQGVDVDSGGYCTSCISDIIARCRPLSSP